MMVEGVDPRTAQWEDDRPAYRVYFWHQPTAPADVDQAHIMWISDEYRITHAADVHEVVAWAEQRVRDDQHYTLYVEARASGTIGTLLLAGIDPTVPDDRS